MNIRLVIVFSLLVGLLSGGGLAALVYYNPPTSVLLALALLLVVMTVMGLFGPVWGAALRKLMPKTDGWTAVVMGMRFGLWSGIFFASLVLLKILDFMDRVLILAILALLIMVETFLQQDTARKKPSRKSKR